MQKETSGTGILIENPVHIVYILKKRNPAIKFRKSLLNNDLMGEGYEKGARERMIGYVSWRTSFSK